MKHGINKMSIDKESMTFQGQYLNYTLAFKTLPELLSMVRKLSIKFYQRDSKAIQDVLTGKAVSLVVELPNQSLDLPRGLKESISSWYDIGNDQVKLS